MDVDVLFVGGGIASLSGALHLSNLIAAHKQKDDGKKLDEIFIVVLEKGASPGAHGISGAVMAPGPLKELVPDFLEKGAPLEGEVKKESIYFLTKTGKIKTPITPPPLNNHGNYVVSMSKLNQWVAGLAEKAGVNIFPEFAGAELLYEGDRVIGVRTGDKGLDSQGNKKGNYESGTDLHAKVTVLGEGSRGNLTKAAVAHYKLDAGKNPPGFEVGVKEVWELPEARLEPGEVVHTMGYPLAADAFGGGFLYGMKGNQVAVGHLTSLDYADPFLDPHREFQKFKLHPLVSGILDGGKLVQYGAKTVPVGGLFSVPELTFPGGMIIGDAANLFNAQKIKGIDLAMRSGMLAAEAIFAALLDDEVTDARLAGYAAAMAASTEMEALRKVRNFHQAMTRGSVARPGYCRCAVPSGRACLCRPSRGPTGPQPPGHDSPAVRRGHCVGRVQGRHQVRRQADL
jgi:electron-transferring-flavoprotein dehydrogenase